MYSEFVSFRPPGSLCAEFEVERCVLPPFKSSVSPLPLVPCGSLLFVLRGCISVIIESAEMELTEGAVLFVGADMQLVMSTMDVETELFRAHTNLGSLV